MELRPLLSGAKGGATRTTTPRVPSFAPPPAGLALDGDEVHVWRVDVGSARDNRDALWRVLAEDERRRAADLVFEEDRERSIVSRGVLRVLLGRYLRLGPGRLVFGHNPYGKPFLVGEGGVSFSVSHSRGLVLLAFSRGREVGVDVERLREGLGLDEIAARCFSVREAAALRSLPNGPRARAFFTCWTRKEAFAKARGMGLALPFDRFDVTVAPEEPASLLAVEGDPLAPARWALRQLDAGPGYAASLAVEAHAVRLSCWRYTNDVLPAEG